MFWQFSVISRKGKRMADATPNPIHPNPMPMRYVIYSPTKGIYLGIGKWSKSDPGYSPDCPTFNSVRIREILAENSEMLKNTPDAESYEIHPDKPGFMASQMAVSNAGLPMWRDKNDGGPSLSAPSDKAKKAVLPGTKEHKDQTYHGQHAKESQKTEEEHATGHTSTPESRRKEREKEPAHEPKPEQPAKDKDTEPVKEEPKK